MACTTVNQTTPMMPSVKLDPRTTTGCTPKAATVDIPPVWSGNVYLCGKQRPKWTVCRSGQEQRPLGFRRRHDVPDRHVQEQDNLLHDDDRHGQLCLRVCSRGLLLRDQRRPGSRRRQQHLRDGGANKNMNVTQTNTCLPIVDATNASFNPKGVNVTAAAACQATGTVTATPNPSGQLTLCCK